MASYVTIQDWMLDLGLNSTELMAYAVICSYGEDGKWFQGSASYLGWWIGTKRKATVLDALKEGFAVAVVKEGCRAVNVAPDDGEKALAEMLAAGATVCELDDLKG